MEILVTALASAILGFIPIMLKTIKELPQFSVNNRGFTIAISKKGFSDKSVEKYHKPPACKCGLCQT